MIKKTNSKLLLVNEEETLYVFKEGFLKPEEVNFDKSINNNFEFIISSNNEFIKNYINLLGRFNFGEFQKADLLDLRRELQLDDISNDINKVRDVNTVLTENGNLNIIDADNIILDSFEITFDNDFNIVKNNYQYRPYIQNPNSALGLFENATLFKPFLEEHLGIDLKYFSFNKNNDQLYINFIDDNNQQYFIKDNLLHAFVKENSISLNNLYQNKYESNYKEDSFNYFKTFYDISSNIKKALNNLKEFNDLENKRDYISSRDSSIIFNVSLTSIACLNNPSFAPALVFLPLAEEVSISLTSNILSNKFNISDDEALFMSKVSYTLVKSGLNNLDIDILDMILDKTNMDDKFNKLIDSTNLDKNIKDALKNIYKETRSADFDNLNIFGLNQIAGETKKEFSLVSYTRNTLKDASDEFNENIIKDGISKHKVYLDKDDKYDKDDKDDEVEL